jgi:hypothetical protein
MALATYTDLQAAIANYLARPGDTLVSTPAPDFVTLAESRIAYGGDAPFQSSALRIRAMKVTAVLITGGVNDAGTGAGTANAQTASLAATPPSSRASLSPSPLPPRTPRRPPSI